MSVFISYSRRDAEFVDLLYRLLDSKGYRIWLDRQDIAVGGRWDVEVQEALNTADYVVVVLSPDAVASQNVADEWSYALSHGRAVIPLYYRECDVPMRLHRLQRINFATNPFAEAFQNLLDVIGEPDNRPTDAIELAKREGFVFVDNRPLPGLYRATVGADADYIRIAFVYSEYPLVATFTSAVWMTLLRTSFDPHTYGKVWVLRDKQTKHIYLPTPEQLQKANTLLLHDVGIEPNSELEVILIESKDQ